MINARKLALIAILTSLAIGTNYAMISLTNIKLMDFIVFIGGFVLGPFWGGFMGMMCWLIYGTLNPFGFGGITLFATMLGEALYGIVGGFLGKFISKSAYEERKQNWVKRYFICCRCNYNFNLRINCNSTKPHVLHQHYKFSCYFLGGVAVFYDSTFNQQRIFFGVGSVPVMQVISKVWKGGDNRIVAIKQ